MASCLPDSIASVVERGFPVAELAIISLAKIRTNDSNELALLAKAASKTGIFHLDLRGDVEGERVLASLPDVYAVVKRYFDQSDETKAEGIRHDIKASQDLGWKKGHGGESFEISRDEIDLAGTSILRLPVPFQDEWERIAQISAGCDNACLTVLNNISNEFGVHHRVDQTSDTGLKFVLHPSVAKKSDERDTLHTDSGTLTMLFFEDWSIHAFLPDDNRWAFTPPREGCALVNVGDALQKLSWGNLHSPKHRVTQLCDGAKNRYYLSYFLRPETALAEAWNAGCPI